MKRIYFKVVRKTHIPDEYKSCVERYNFKLDLNYKVGQVTTPFIGKIFIFNTLKNTISFLKSEMLWSVSINKIIPSYCILRVHAVGNVHSLKTNIPLSDTLIGTFWRDYKEKKQSSDYIRRPPEGTFLADAVTVLNAM